MPSYAESLRMHHTILYESNRNGNYYHTVEDEVVEVLTDGQDKSWLSSYIDYIDNFVGVSLVCAY